MGQQVEWEMVSHEERNVIFAEYVLDWTPGTGCNGRIVAHPMSLDDWLCWKCGATGRIGDYGHVQPARNYTGSLDLLIPTIIQRFGGFRVQTTPLRDRYDATVFEKGERHSATGDSPADALCCAALKACGCEPIRSLFYQGGGYSSRPPK